MVMLQTMYPGVANSPNTFLKEDLTRDAAVMYLADGSVLGTLPTLAVIGGGTDAETVLVTSTRSDGGFAIERGVEGYKKAWKKAEPVARNWTNKDYETLVHNITTNSESVASLHDYADEIMRFMQEDVLRAVGAKVDTIAGKGLSTHDYDDAAKAKVDGIPANPKYTDTVPDLSPYAKMSDLSKEYDERTADISKVMSDHATDIQGVKADIKTAKDALTEDINNAKAAHDADIQRLESQKLNKSDVPTELSQLTEDSEHRTVTDAEKAKVQAIPPNPKYTDTIPDLTPYAKKADVPTKQLLYDIFMGESLVTKKEGEWPVVHGKPTSIGDKAFISSRLTGVIIPPRVTSIGSKAFYNNKLTIVIIPPSVTSIGNYAFYGNQLTSVVIPSSVTSIGRSAFAGGRLTSVVIPPHVKNIEQEAFYGNALTSVVIPPSVTSIGSEAFRSNYFTEVKVPKNCTVANDAFDASVNIIRY